MPTHFFWGNPPTTALPLLGGCMSAWCRPNACEILGVNGRNWKLPHFLWPWPNSTSQCGRIWACLCTWWGTPEGKVVEGKRHKGGESGGKCTKPTLVRGSNLNWAKAVKGGQKRPIAAKMAKKQQPQAKMGKQKPKAAKIGQKWPKLWKVVKLDVSGQNWSKAVMIHAQFSLAWSPHHKSKEHQEGKQFVTGS